MAVGDIDWFDGFFSRRIWRSRYQRTPLETGNNTLNFEVWLGFIVSCVAMIKTAQCRLDSQSRNFFGRDNGAFCGETLVDWQDISHTVQICEGASQCCVCLMKEASKWLANKERDQKRRRSIGLYNHFLIFFDYNVAYIFAPRRRASTKTLHFNCSFCRMIS